MSSNRFSLTGLLLVLLVSATGCEGGAEPPPPSDAGVDADPSTPPCLQDGGALDGGVARGLTNVCAQGLVMSGFGLRWDDGSHRVSRWGVVPRIGAEHFPEGCPPGSALRGAALVAELEGGPETRGTGAPGGQVFASYHVVGAGTTSVPPDAGTWQGVRIVRGSVSLELEAEPEATAPVLFDLASARMRDAPSVAVVLDGLELDTDVPQAIGYPTDYDPQDGYSVRGIGAGLEDVRREEGALRFTARARFALGRRDRPAMDRAIGGARTRVTVHYAVVALPREPVRSPVTYRERSLCRPDPEQTAVTSTGEPGLPAAPALTRFALDLFPDAEGQGDDVRELSVRIVGFTFDAASGQARLRLEAHASNEGPPAPARPMDYVLDAEVVLLQWQGEPARELVLTAPVAAGRTETAMPLTPR
jgi:hypothetical protein